MAVDLGLGPGLLQWEFSGGWLIRQFFLHEGGLLEFNGPGLAARWFPRSPAVGPPEPKVWVEELATWSAALSSLPRSNAQPAPTVPLPWAALSPTQRARWEEMAIRDPAATREIARRWNGEDGPVGLIEEPAGPSRLVFLSSGAALETGSCFSGLVEALEAWADLETARVEEDRRRSALLRTLGREAARVERGFLALESEERSAPDAARLRRQAEALLAAGPGVTWAEPGIWRVADPYGEEGEIEILAPPAMDRPQQAAEALFQRARKVERGRAQRATRSIWLRERLGRLRELLSEVEAVPRPGPEPLSQWEDRARELGFAFGLTPGSFRSAGSAVASRNRGSTSSAPGGGARFFRSPGGFEVLVGRSAAQNDFLTFKVAAPDDLWFHCSPLAGAHVILRTGGRKEIPKLDLLFAAGLAAAFSRAVEGETVEVLWARRKRVRKPKGAKAGAVVVSSAARVSVKTPRTPAD